MYGSPAAIGSSAAAESPASASAETARPDLVLLVEDNDMVASLVECVLTRRGHRVLRVGDGEAGEREFAAHESEVLYVVLDCHLPDRDGRNVARHLRERCSDLPILLMSGENGVKSALQGQRLAYLSKPFGPRQLHERVDALLRATA